MPFFSKSDTSADQTYRLLYQAKDALLLAHGIRTHLPELLRGLSPFTEGDLRELERQAQLVGTALTITAELTLQAADGKKGARPLRNVALQPEDDRLVTPVFAALGGATPISKARLDWSEPLVSAVAAALNGLNQKASTDPLETIPRHNSRPDYGTYLASTGHPDTKRFFYDVPLTHISKIADQEFTTMAEIQVAGKWFAASFDMRLQHVQLLLSRIPQETTVSIARWLTKAEIGATLEFRIPVTVTIEARVGELQVGAREQFRPLIVSSIA